MMGCPQCDADNQLIAEARRDFGLNRVYKDRFEATISALVFALETRVSACRHATPEPHRDDALLLSKITELAFDPYEDVPLDNGEALLERIRELRAARGAAHADE